MWLKIKKIKDRYNGLVVTHPCINPARPGLTSELVCLPLLFSTKPSYFLVGVDTCTHWVPVVVVVFVVVFVFRIIFGVDIRSYADCWRVANMSSMSSGEEQNEILESEVCFSCLTWPYRPFVRTFISLTNAYAGCSRPTLNFIERFWLGSVSWQRSHYTSCQLCAGSSTVCTDYAELSLAILFYVI